VRLDRGSGDAEDARASSWGPCEGSLEDQVPDALRGCQHLVTRRAGKSGESGRRSGKEDDDLADVWLRCRRGWVSQGSPQRCVPLRSPMCRTAFERGASAA